MDHKIVMVYYSLEGNTDYVAHLVSQKIPVDLVRLIPEKEPPKKGFKRFAIGGKSALSHEKVGLKPLNVNFEDYDTMILACPVWASTYPPAVGEFLARYPVKDKRIYFIGTSMSGNAFGMLQKIGDKIAPRYSGNKVIASLSLKSPLKYREETQRKIAEFLDWK